MPLLVYAIYVGVKAIKNCELPNNIESYLIGITSACILWIKYTMLGFYIGYFLFFLLYSLKKQERKKFFINIIFIALGVITVSIPILLYFVTNSALSDLWKVYFYDNIFAYTQGNGNIILSIIYNLCYGIETSIAYNIFITMVIYAGCIVTFLKRDFEEFKFILITYICLILGIYCGRKAYFYYPLITSAFFTISLCKIHYKFSQLNDNLKFGKKCEVILSIVAYLSIFANSMNISSLLQEKDELPQYIFAKIMNEKENPTLLNYGFLDGGFYTVADILPNCYFYYKSNIPLEEQTAIQRHYVDEKLVDFVVTRNYKLYSENYECIAEEDYYYYGVEKTTFYLHKLVK